MKNPGMRIIRDFERPSKESIERFREIPAANISDASSRLFAMHAGIKPLGKKKKLIGPALTVKSSMADNFIFHKALTLAKPGDIMVVNACGDTNHSVCGDVMFRYAQKMGVAGFVVDGCIRDADYLQENDFPVFALGTTPRGPYKNPVGEINTDIACAGQVIHPGDLIVGDEDGVVVVRQEDMDVIYEKVMAVRKKEALMSEIIESGEWEEKSPIYLYVQEQIEKLAFEII